MFGIRGNSAILISLLAAFVLASMPLPGGLGPFRPLWVPMTLLYWCLAMPNRVGVGVAWSCGLASDILHGGILGQHALSYLLLAYISIMLHRQIRVYPLIQQSAYVLLALMIQQMVVYWIEGILGNQLMVASSYWWPTLISSLVWAPFFLLMRAWRRRAQLH
ncbi:MAG: rod shape-determining protein MreD [Gammaproteobacteria bacterium]|nr:rod shape-determining protein MreD [Gammaproteobacteria bacterium]